MNPHGVRLKPELRASLAWRAYVLREQKHLSAQKIADELDVSTPTARNLVAYGRRLAADALADVSYRRRP